MARRDSGSPPHRQPRAGSVSDHADHLDPDLHRIAVVSGAGQSFLSPESKFVRAPLLGTLRVRGNMCWLVRTITAINAHCDGLLCLRFCARIAYWIAGDDQADNCDRQSLDRVVNLVPGLPGDRASLKTRVAVSWIAGKSGATQ